MGKSRFPFFSFHYGFNIYSMRGRSIYILIWPWPDDEQEVGCKVRALANIQVNFGRWFFHIDRYCPNRAEYWMRNAYAPQTA